MINAVIALAAMMVYLLLLFGVAHYADHKRKLGKSIVSNPYVYALSLSIYCTAWTFYGSIGRAASSGLSFLTIYLGPTLAMLLGWLLIRKMIRVSKEYRLTSISDFISFRYGRSYAIGAMVTIIALVAITPYVALQLIAISNSITIISGEPMAFGVRRLIVTVLLGIFAIMFGARHLDPMERHEGLIAAVAFESFVKLIAFLAAGIYITYGIFGGYRSILEGISSSPEYSHLLQVDYISWFSLILISFFSMLLLPRQFHVMVVENSAEDHLKKAMWLFPLYLLLINLFAPAIAWGGLLLNTPGDPDMFIVNIPIINGHDLLALFIFIGGTSAATAMVLVSSVAVGTMMLNGLEMPHLVRWIGKGRDLPSLLLNMKRVNILIVLALGYLYSIAVEYQSLVDIGLVSFVAASQLAPAAIGGLYWKKASREGAIVGLASGFLLWIYTAMIPTLVKAGWLSEGILTNGPFGIALLRPTSLLGMDLDIWTHTVFWTLLINCSLFVLVSLMSRPNPEETALSHSFVDVYKEHVKPMVAERRMIRTGTVDELESTLAKYIGAEKAEKIVDIELDRLNTSKDRIDALELLELRDHLERILTGSVGSSATRMIVEEEVPVEPVAEVVKTTRATYDVNPGRIYIIPDKEFEVFTDQITHGIEGLCITVLDPDEIRERWGFFETPIIRLSHVKGRGERYIAPTNLPLLFITIKSFVERSQNSIILLDNIEYLIQENLGIVPEAEVLDFVSAIEDLSYKNSTRLVLLSKPEFVNKPLDAEINEVNHLIFILGPLSSYLFNIFVNAMLAELRDSSQRAMVRVFKTLSEHDDLFKGVTFDGEAICVDSSVRFTRQNFFAALIRLENAILKLEPDFELESAVLMPMEKYRLSPYEILLRNGMTYVIEEEKPLRSLEIFSEMMHCGVDGLCISRYHPEKLQERYNISPENVIWLTQTSGSELRYRCVEPTNLPRLSSMITDFLLKSENPLILLEGVGYLITQSNYESILRFIQSQRDEIAMRDAILLIHIDPLALDTKELHRLKSEMEPLET